MSRVHSAVSRLRRLFSAAAGFSLVEIIAVTAMVGIVAVIAIPVTVSQQRNAQEQTARGDLRVMEAGLYESINMLRGAPPETLNICHAATTWPSAATPTSTCADGVWRATRASNGAALSPDIYGRVSAGTVLQGRVAADGSYCVNATRDGSTYFRIASTDREVQDGSCHALGWGATGGKSGSSGLVASGTLPAAPTGVTVDANQGTDIATVRWNAVAGTTYAISVTGHAEKRVTASATAVASCVFPAATCTGAPTGVLNAGKYVASVKAVNADGSGPDSIVPFEMDGNPKTIQAKFDMNLTGMNAPRVEVAKTRENQFKNPSFEEDANGWYIRGGTITRSTAQKFVGGASAALQRTGTTTDDYTEIQVTGLKPNTAYTASAYLRLPTGANAAQTYQSRPVMWLINYPGGTTVKTAQADFAKTNQWQRLSATNSTSASSTYLNVRFYLPSGGAPWYIDGILVEEGTATKEYFDGSSTPYALWTSTSNASTSILNVAGRERGRAKVSWDPPAGSDTSQVTYIVRSDPGDYTCKVTSATSCYVEGLDDDTNYTFTVAAITSAGIGAASPTSPTIKTPTTPQEPARAPSAPLGVSAEPTLTGKITLTWKPPADSGGARVEDYILERNSGSGWAIVNDGTGTGTSYVFTGLTRDTTYQFRVSAKNAAGTSQVSNVATTVPGYPPSAVTLHSGPNLALSSGTVTVTTSEPTGGATVTTGYSTSSTITNPADLPAGTSASTNCSAGMCTHTWNGFGSKLGTKWYFYVFSTVSNGYSLPVVASQAAPQLVDSMVAGLVASPDECPVDYDEDLGNGWCRQRLAYSYSWGIIGYHEEYSGAWPADTHGCGFTYLTGDGTMYSTVQIGNTCYANPKRSVADYGNLKDPPPDGWADDGKSYYRDAAKTSYRTYRLSPTMSWTDDNLNLFRFGEVWMNGVKLQEGTSENLGRCAGTVRYSLKGLGGTSNGSITFPCN